VRGEGRLRADADGQPLLRRPLVGRGRPTTVQYLVFCGRKKQKINFNLLFFI
jgi:hypothetical protein